MDSPNLPEKDTSPTVIVVPSVNFEKTNVPKRLVDEKTSGTPKRKPAIASITPTPAATKQQFSDGMRRASTGTVEDKATKSVAVKKPGGANAVKKVAAKSIPNSKKSMKSPIGLWEINPRRSSAGSGGMGNGNLNSGDGSAKRIIALKRKSEDVNGVKAGNVKKKVQLPPTSASPQVDIDSDTLEKVNELQKALKELDRLTLCLQPGEKKVSRAPMYPLDAVQAMMERIQKYLKQREANAKEVTKQKLQESKDRLKEQAELNLRQKKLMIALREEREKNQQATSIVAAPAASSAPGLNLDSSAFVDTIAPILDSVWMDAMVHATDNARNRVKNWRNSSDKILNKKGPLSAQEVAMVVDMNKGNVLDMTNLLHPKWNQSYRLMLADVYTHACNSVPTATESLPSSSTETREANQSLHAIEQRSRSRDEDEESSDESTEYEVVSIDSDGGKQIRIKQSKKPFKPAFPSAFSTRPGILGSVNNSQPSEKSRRKPNFLVKPGTGCLSCHKDDDYDKLLICDNDCGREYHYYCLEPPLESVPTGIWICPTCFQYEKCTKGSKLIRCFAVECNKNSTNRYCFKHRCRASGCLLRAHTEYGRCKRHINRDNMPDDP